MFAKDTEVVLALQRGHCPDCGNKQFIEGPHGGSCVNIECENCGANFNVGALAYERIGWNLSGRWINTRLSLDEQNKCQ